MKIRTPDAVIAGTGMLKGWRLLFRQFATIRKCAGYSVPVVVRKISEQDEKNLDMYEGFPKLYIKKNLKLNVTSLDGYDLGNLTAMVYIMTKKAQERKILTHCPTNIIIQCLHIAYYCADVAQQEGQMSDHYP